MPKDLSYKVSEFLYQGYRPFPSESAINSFGLALENGQRSPVFKGLEKDLTSICKVKMSDVGNVQKVVAWVGSCSDILKIEFLDAQNNLVCEVATMQEGGKREERKLDLGEEIIGIFGAQGVFDYVSCLGFIVWKPPHLFE
jgi:hypothetical protein